MIKHIKTLLLFIGLVLWQDKTVIVKMKNSKIIIGKILHGKDLNDYYVRLFTEDKKIKDIYTIDIASEKDEKLLTKPLSSRSKVTFKPYDNPPVPMSSIRPKYPKVAQEAGIKSIV